jgi:hypothetical protein
MNLTEWLTFTVAHRPPTSSSSPRKIAVCMDGVRLVINNIEVTVPERAPRILIRESG